MSKPILLSGIQPSGNLHIGNYLGAVKNWVALQNSGKYDCYFFVVDYHSLTGNMKAADRRRQISATAAELLAAGIDAEKSTFFVQSHVPMCAELAWIFNCVTPIVELYRMTQFKDKSERQEKNINAGLLTYPILQAADVFLYHGQLVPVGQDQIQHLELTRGIARWFNARYGGYFPEPKPMLTETPKVMSLIQPEKKMSKSLGAGHVLDMQDEPEEIEKKLKRAVTATVGGGHNPGVENLLALMKNFGSSGVYTKYLKAEKEGSIKYGDLKAELSSAIANYFKDFRKKRVALLADNAKIEKFLAVGAAKARSVAEKTMEEVRKLVGVK